MALLLNLNTTRRSYLVYLNLAEYIVVPYVQQISEYINNINNAIYIYTYIYIYIYIYILTIVDIVLDYFLVSG